MHPIDTDKISALLNKGVVFKKYPLANLENRKRKEGSEWIDYYIVWPFKPKDSFQPLSHAYTEAEAWRLAAKRIEKSETH
jgi:hypothetical protein